MQQPFPETGFFFCTPEPRLCAGVGLPPGVAAAFEAGEAQVFFYLATAGLQEEVPAPLEWVRDWGRLFVLELCKMRDPRTVALPDGDAVQGHLLAAPPILGAEYLSAVLLERVWVGLRDFVAQSVEASGLGLAEWLGTQGSLWHLVGRVTFHLAENKLNAAAPFAFFATYTDQLSQDGRVQHTPLGRALQSYQKNPASLESLMQPVRAAAKESALVGELLETKRLFQALAWTSQEAYCLLRQIPQLEACGLVVRLPDWWKGRRANRPVVSVTLDAAESSGLGLESMLRFRVEMTLGGAPLTPEEMQQIRASPTGLVNLRGQWVEVDQEKLQQAIAHWGRVEMAHQSGALSFHEGMRWLAGFRELGGAAGDVSELDVGRDWSEVLAGKGLEELLRRLKAPAPVDAIPGLNATLRPYQQAGVGWLHFSARLGLGACLADDMGLGKTLQILALLCLRKAADGVKTPSVLVVPASLLGNWLREARLFAPDLKILAAHPSLVSRETLESLEKNPEQALSCFDAVLVSYGMLQRSRALQEADWDLAVLDEAQAIKNPATAQARSVKALRARARVALTGTPVENRLGDLWGLFDFLNPGLLGKATAFAEAAKAMAGRPDGYAPLRRLLGPYLLRRLKTDRRVIADLPEKIEMQTRCSLSKRQAILYARLVEQLKAELEVEGGDPAQRRGLVLGYLTKFKQVCNHPSHWSGDGKFLPEDSGKFASLSRIAEQLAERQERCLVFTQFREMAAPIASFLGGVFGRPGLVLHGGTPVGQRQKLVEAFQRADGPPFFVLSLKAGGTGLTLTAANHVIHFDRWWNPAVENQATDRAFRIGQKRSVLVHKFVSPGTIEEKVDALLQKKRVLAEELLSGEDGAHKLLTEMSNQELLDFVRLDIEAACL